MKECKFLNKLIRGVTLRGIFIAILINVFFAGLIFVYYTMLYAETQEAIMKSGKISAISSAEQIDKFLSTGIDTIKLASYTIDNMIRDGRSQGEIQDYLLNQSVAVVNITSGESPGLYGVINGEYLDGTGWTPSVSYVPESRPWYIEARANLGQVAVVNPYLDLDSQTIMIALSKTLCDTKSVVSMDFSMDKLQRITEEIAAQNEGEMEIILDGSYKVVAHSDKSEVGKCYLDGGNSFGTKMVKELRTIGSDSFTMRYGENEYMVHIVPVANEWMCISVVNATNALFRLRSLLMATVIAITVSVTILISLLSVTNRKNRIAAQLTENLSQAESDIREKENRIGEISRVAFSDGLTGVGSKAAFNQYIENFARGIEGDTESYAAVMVDANGLKYINDNFGHASGDKYLCGCCKAICETYKHSPVFRIGGDEFAVVLTGKDYENRAELLKEIEETFEKSYAQEDKEPWECYSAAVGMAEYREGDTGIGQVLRRADKEMYRAKEAFKKVHGRYR